jgi:PilZ domain
VAEAEFIDRRSRQRICFESPATVTTGQHTIAASVKEINDRGLFFFTDARLEVGSEIDIVITLPDELGLPLSGMVCCHARVVRSDFGVSQHGVAAKIDRFAPLPQV